MSLESIVKKITELKPIIEEDLSDGNPQTMGGKRGRQNRAKEEIKILTEQYSDAMRKSAVFIFAVGAAKEEFAKQAAEGYSAFIIDPSAFYKDLASRVHPTLYLNRDASTAVFDVMTRHLEDKMMELGVIGYPQLIFKAHYMRKLESVEDFENLIKEAINEQVGAEIAAIDAVKTIAKQAIEKNYDQKYASVVFLTEDENLVLPVLDAIVTQLGNPAYLVAAGKTSKTFKRPGVLTMKEVNEETMTQTMTTIKTSLKRVL